MDKLDILNAIRFAIVAPEHSDAPHGIFSGSTFHRGCDTMPTSEFSARAERKARRGISLPDSLAASARRWPQPQGSTHRETGCRSPRPRVAPLDARRPPDHHGREHQRAGDHDAPPRPRAEASVRLRTLGGPR